MVHLKRFLMIFLLGIFLVGCKTQGENITPTMQLSIVKPTEISPDSGFGGITGSVKNAGDFWSERNLTIYAAEFYGDLDEGVYLLEPMQFPKGSLNQEHFFQISNIPPKRYLLLVGPNPESALFVKADGKPLIVEVIADQVLNIGQVEIGP